VTITRRVTVAPAADNTKRIAASGAVAAVDASLTIDLWTRSWGGTWGFTWYGVSAAIAGVAASPAIDVTARVSEAAVAAITANHTKRVTEAVV
jgi:hypothetical protein